MQLRHLMLALALSSAALAAQGQQGQWKKLSGAQAATNPSQQGNASYAGAPGAAPAQGANQDGTDPNPHRSHGPPPPEALAACQGKTAGASCSFTGKHGPKQGTCGAPPDTPMACRHHEHDAQGAEPPGQRQRPARGQP